MQRIIVTALIAGALALGGCGGDNQQASEAASAAEIVIATTESTAGIGAATGAETGAAGATAADAAAPAAPEDQPAPGEGAPAGMRPGVSGEVVAVDGATVTVQDQRQQSTVSVLLSDDTQFFTQAAVDLANVAVGESVTAMGTQAGDVFTAMRVQVGAGSSFGGGPQGGGPGGMTPPDGQQPPDAAGDNAGGPPGDMDGAMLVGTVTAASAEGLTVTTADGATVQVVLADGAQATQQAQTTAADITVGSQIMATGEPDGATVTATSVQIMAGPGFQP